MPQKFSNMVTKWLINIDELLYVIIYIFHILVTPSISAFHQVPSKHFLSNNSFYRVNAFPLNIYIYYINVTRKFFRNIINRCKFLRHV